jgi:hypothetical protein
MRIARRPWAAAVAALAALLAGCSPDLPAEPQSQLQDLRGDWSYSATALRLDGFDPASSCEVKGLTMAVGPWIATGMTGATSGGELSCTGQLAPLSGTLDRYVVRGGGMVQQFVSFELGGPDWRNDGVLTADTMAGDVKLSSGGVQFHGLFKAIRRTRP